MTPLSALLPPPLHNAVLDALAVLLPVDCAGCGAPDRALCRDCAAALVAHPVERRLGDGTPAVSALDYAGAVRRAILSVKETGRTDVARSLAAPLRVAIGATAATGAEVLAVPTSRAAFRRRGYDPVALLLRRAGVRSARELVVARRAVQQKSLAVGERSANRAGYLRASRPLDGRRFLLVDDVLTTGATLGEAARAVRAAGGEVVAAATLAFTPKRIQGSDDRSLNGR